LKVRSILGAFFRVGGGLGGDKDEAYSTQGLKRTATVRSEDAVLTRGL